MRKEKLILPSVDLGRCQSTADYALAFARAGMPVIPLYTALKPGVCSCGKTDCTSVAKHPRTKSWKDDKSVDPGDIKRCHALINYMLNRWESFTRFLESGVVPMENNAAERVLKYHRSTS